MRIAMTFFSTIRRYCKAEAGVAAIEFAFILPFMLLLYFGLLDLTGLVSANRKMTSTASIVADLVGQNRTTVTSARISDYMLVSKMINNPLPDSGVTVRVIDYRKVGSAAAKQWSKTSSAGPGCTAPSTTGMTDLMTANNDIIVAQACMVYKPYVATFLGNSILGAATFKLQQDIMVRPRSTTTLACTGCPAG
jgi:Flp pilus assembly protein TadG